MATITRRSFMVRRGVKSRLGDAKSGGINKARALSNPDLSPHPSFVDMVIRVTSDDFETDFIAFLGRSSVLSAPMEAHKGADE